MQHRLHGLGFQLAQQLGVCLVPRRIAAEFLRLGCNELMHRCFKQAHAVLGTKPVGQCGVVESTVFNVFDDLMIGHRLDNLRKAFGHIVAAGAQGVDGHGKHLGPT